MNSSQAGVVDDLRRELNEPLQQPIDAMQLPTSWFRPNSAPPLHQKKKREKEINAQGSELCNQNGE